MNSLIRTAIRALVAPSHKLSVSDRVWREGVAELQGRGHGRRESGAFLLGQHSRGTRNIHLFAYYDDLDPYCLDTGIVRFSGAAYGKLWDLCSEKQLAVVADVHTHPGVPFQSPLDRDHPMIAQQGHVGLIVSFFAARDTRPASLGIYEYVSGRQWKNRSPNANQYFYIGRWG